MIAVMIIGILLGILLGSDRLQWVIRDQIDGLTHMFQIKNQMRKDKASGKHWFEITMDNSSPSESKLISYLDRKKISYSLTNQGRQSVHFRIDLDQPTKVLSRNDNVLEVQFGKNSRNKPQEDAKILPFSSRKQA